MVSFRCSTPLYRPAAALACVSSCSWLGRSGCIEVGGQQMPSVGEIWERIRHRPNVPRAFAEIPAGHVLMKLPGPQSILPNRHYFGIVVDELFLADARQWRKTYDPMIL